MTCDSIRQSFKTKLIKQFLEALSEGNLGSLFVAIGKTTPWNNESSPPDSSDTLNDETEFWKQCIALKKVKTEDLSLVIPRYNWTSGTVYDSYRDDVELFQNSYKFFVLVDNKRIYKVIDNNDGAASSIKPQETSTNIFKTGDGYTWKFIYQIGENDSKFLTDSFVPVFRVTTTTGANDPRQAQLDVQNAAIDGSIQFVDILDVGSSFVFTIDGVSSGSHIIDAGTTSAAQYRISGTEVSLVSGVYLNYSLKITDPDSTNYGEIRKITAYNGGTRIVTLASNFSDPNDVIGYDFSVIPTLEITGDGTGAIFEAKMDDTGFSLGSVDIISGGTGYTYGTIYAYGGSTTASNAQFDVVISPADGHGFNPIDELGTNSLMISMKFEQNEDGLIQTNSDFRQFALISNPSIGGTGIGMSEDTIHSYFVFSDTPIVEFDDLTTGQSKLIGSDSKFVGTFHQYIATIGNPRSGTLKILNPTKKFIAGDRIVTANSDFTNGSVTDVEIDRFVTEEQVTVKNVYRQTTQLDLSSISEDFLENTFQEDLVVRGSVSGATGKVSSWNRDFVTGTGFSETDGILDLVDVLGGFTTGDTLSQFDASGTETTNIASVVAINTPEIDHHSGQMLYLENIQVLERSANQREEVRLILSI